MPVNLLSGLLRPVVTALAVVLCVVVGVFDGLTGPDYSLGPFYLVPVVLAAWFVGMGAGIFLSVTGALVWLVAERAGGRYYQLDLAMYWNDFMELLLFLMTALIVSAIRGALEREHELSLTDPLSGLPNRRHYYELVTAEIRRNHRYDTPFTVVYLDIDNFKTVNDTMGHVEGDKLLRSVGAIITAAIRETNTAAQAALRREVVGE